MKKRFYKLFVASKVLTVSPISTTVFGLKSKDVVLTTTVDAASMNIKQRLIEGFGFRESEKTFEGYPVYERKDALILTVDGEMIYRDGVDREIEDRLGLRPSMIIFASRHSSRQKLPTLTTHVTGNWGQAVYGGKDGELALAHPTAMKLALMKLNELNDLGWLVCYEATHHGPSDVSVPSLFIEIGSSEDEWGNERAGEIVAETIDHVLRNYRRGYDFRSALGVGGGHYAPKQTRYGIEGELAFGHILPKYAQPVDESMLKQAIEKTFGGVEVIAVDWKGSRGETRQMAKRLAEELDLEFMKL